MYIKKIMKIKLLNSNTLHSLELNDHSTQYKNWSY